MIYYIWKIYDDAISAEGWMDDPITAVEHAFKGAARTCLRLVVNRSLTPHQHKALAKWIFGCLNQRYRIRRRVEEHGAGELRKAMAFIGTVYAVVLEIDSQSPNPP